MQSFGDIEVYSRGFYLTVGIKKRYSFIRFVGIDNVVIFFLQRCYEISTNLLLLAFFVCKVLIIFCKILIITVIQVFFIRLNFITNQAEIGKKASKTY